MARRVFFSFHYDNDVWRANVVRHSWVTKPNSESAGFIDHADFEQIQRKGDYAVKRWIDDQLSGTSVTVVLIGSETLQRPFVLYELQKSYERGNGIIGIYINEIRNQTGQTCSRCSIYNVEIGKNSSSIPIFLSEYPIYDWNNDRGYDNMGRWIEAAAQKVGR